jgi:hypothetical protein
MHDLQLFLDYMHLTARFPGLIHPLGFNIEIAQARILLPLIEQFDCVAMGLFLRRKLFSSAFDQPWELLHLACDCDDIELGRKAIRGLSPRRLQDFAGSNRYTTGWTSLSKLSDSWRSEFLRLLMPGSRMVDFISIEDLDTNTRIWSKTFNPVRYTQDVDADGKRKRVCEGSGSEM